MAKKTLPTHPIARASVLKRMPPPASPSPAKKAAAKGKGKMYGRPVPVPDQQPRPQTQGNLALETEEPTTEPLGQVLGSYLAHPLLADLPDLLARQQQLAAIKKAGKEAEEADKELRAEIEGLLLASGADEEGVTCGPYKVTRTEVDGKWTIDETALLEAGVDADVIVAAKVQSQGYSFVTVKKGKE